MRLELRPDEDGGVHVFANGEEVEGVVLLTDQTDWNRDPVGTVTLTLLAKDVDRGDPV